MDSLKEKIIKVLIGMLLIIMMGLITYRIYYKFAIEPNKLPTPKSGTKEKIEPKVLYNNTKNATMGVCSDGVGEEDEKTLTLDIKDGKLIAKLDGLEIEVKGLSGKIKSFVYDKIGCADCTLNNEIVIVINDNNELFYTDAYHYKRDNYMTFEKINIDEKIVDITKLEMNTIYSTCDENNLAAVLEDGTIKYFKIETEYDDASGYQKAKIESLDKIDLSNFKMTVAPYLMIYNDNTIGDFDFKGEYGKEFKERLQYNGETLRVKKLFYNEGNESNKTYILNEDNKLYVIDHELDYDNLKSNNLMITLIRDSKVKSESIDTQKGQLYKYEKETDVDITFADGNIFKIEGINRIYNAN